MLILTERSSNRAGSFDSSGGWKSSPEINAPMAVYAAQMKESRFINNE